MQQKQQQKQQKHRTELSTTVQGHVRCCVVLYLIEQVGPVDGGTEQLSPLDAQDVHHVLLDLSIEQRHKSSRMSGDAITVRYWLRFAGALYF